MRVIETMLHSSVGIGALPHTFPTESNVQHIPIPITALRY